MERVHRSYQSHNLRRWLREEAIKFKHKLVYFMLGCAFVVVGQLLLSIAVPRVTAQGDKASNEFDTLKVRKLQIVDSLGKVCALLEKVTDNSGIGPIIQVLNSSGVPVCSAGVSPQGGILHVTGNDGNFDIMISGRPGGSTVTAYDAGRKSGVAMRISPSGGSVAVHSKDGKDLAGMMMTSEGGEVHVCGKDGKIRASMMANRDGGGTSVFGRNGDLRAVMKALRDLGGCVITCGNDGTVSGTLPAVRDASR